MGKAMMGDVSRLACVGRVPADGDREGLKAKWTG